MLIEALELKGHHVISANTDGIVTLVPVGREGEYYDICNEWEVIIGNDKQGKLEYTEYQKIVQTSVNDYLAIDIDGKIKRKGDFAIDVELHKDNSKRIVPIALSEYFVNDVPVEETIRGHENIYSFCIGKKSSKDYFYRMIDKSTGNVIDLKHLIRYYCSVSKDKFEKKSDEEEEVDKIVPGKLYKIKSEHSEKRGPRVSQCESGSLNQVYFNRYFPVDKFSDYKIDYLFYEELVHSIIEKVDPYYKRDRKIKKSGQIMLF